MFEIESLKEAFITKRMNIPFVSKVKTKYDLSLADANVVANKFYQKKEV